MSYYGTDYATSQELKDYLRIADNNDDDQIALALTASSRAVDRATHRAFGLDDPAIARHWTFERAKGATFTVYPITDLSAASGVIVKADTNDDGTFDTTATSDQYQLLPVDAEVNARPYREIAVHSDLTDGDGVFRLEITAKWGWVSVPDTITQSVILQASRLFKRRDAPFGVAGSPELGSELRLLDKLDPDVAVLVSHYKRRWAVV